MIYKRRSLNKLAALSALAVLLAIPSVASDQTGKYTEEFHQSYAITADGRLELSNVNGSVHITAWDKNEVKVDAVKYANSQEKLAEAKIEVEATSNSISIRTKYPNHDNTWNWGGSHNPATVEYTVMVPKTIRLDEVNLVNSDLNIEGVTGEVEASCVNGRLTAKGLGGRTKLSNVNGRIEVGFDQLSGSWIDISSVNGGVEVTLPSDAKAEIEASTVSGGIDNDFGLHNAKHQWVGHNLRGDLGGGGGTKIKVSNVNGHIEIRHANDGKAMSPAKDRGGDKDEDDDSI
jgi:DUF4097 and DUF4098 domain-containing protein YvlB